MEREAVLLTGGKSSRMGFDKASLVVDGESMASRTARLLGSVTDKVTVLGREPVEGFGLISDESPYKGPLAALKGFVPRARSVFLCACDMPLFDPRIVTLLQERLAEHEPDMAIVPVLDGHLQPLCALYRASAFQMIKTVCAEGQQSLMAWLDALWVETVDETQIRAAGVDPRSLVSADTPAAFEQLVGPK